MAFNDLINPRKGLWAETTMKKKFPKRKEEIEDLFQQEDIQLFQPARRKFERRQMLAKKVNENWQIDLMDISPFAEENDGHQFLLTRIDILSRQADAVPLMNKSAREIVRGLEELFIDQQPKRISSDLGTEFKNQIGLTKPIKKESDLS